MGKIPSNLFDLMRAIALGYYPAFGKIFDDDGGDRWALYLIPSPSLMQVWIDNCEIG